MSLKLAPETELEKKGIKYNSDTEPTVPKFLSEQLCARGVKGKGVVNRGRGGTY